MPRPVLLLDVDGVLNPYSTAECPAGFSEYDLFPGEEPVRLCAAHGEWIDDLHPAEAWTWSTRRQERTLLIPVAPAIGLTRQAVDQALRWARNA